MVAGHGGGHPDRQGGTGHPAVVYVVRDVRPAAAAVHLPLVGEAVAGGRHSEERDGLMVERAAGVGGLDRDGRRILHGQSHRTGRGRQGQGARGDQAVGRAVHAHRGRSDGEASRRRPGVNSAVAHIGPGPRSKLRLPAIGRGARHCGGEGGASAGGDGGADGLAAEGRRGHHRQGGGARSGGVGAGRGSASRDDLVMVAAHAEGDPGEGQGRRGGAAGDPSIAEVCEACTRVHLPLVGAHRRGADREGGRPRRGNSHVPGLRLDAGRRRRDHGQQGRIGSDARGDSPRGARHHDPVVIAVQRARDPSYGQGGRGGASIDPAVREVCIDVRPRVHLPLEGEGSGGLHGEGGIQALVGGGVRGLGQDDRRLRGPYGLPDAAPIGGDPDEAGVGGDVEIGNTDHGQAHPVPGPGGPRVRGDVEPEVCASQEGGVVRGIVLDDVDRPPEGHAVARGEAGTFDVLPGGSPIGGAPEVLDRGTPTGVGRSSVENVVVGGVEPDVAEGHFHASRGVDGPLVGPGGAAVGADPAVGRVDDSQLVGIQRGGIEVPDVGRGVAAGKAHHAAGDPGLSKIGGLVQLVACGGVGRVASGVGPSRLHSGVERGATGYVDAAVPVVERVSSVGAVAQVHAVARGDDFVAIQLVNQGSEAIARGVGLIELGAGGQGRAGAAPGAVVLETDGHPVVGTHRVGGRRGAQVID